MPRGPGFGGPSVIFSGKIFLFFGQSTEIWHVIWWGNPTKAMSTFLSGGGGEAMEGLPKKVAPGPRKALGGPDPNVITETLIYA